MRQHTVGFANFVCKFGEENLLDYAEEVVIPAFLRPGLIRRHRDTSYFLLNQKLINFGDGGEADVAVCGQFVKTTVLKRSQVFVLGEGLVDDEAEIDSAPSAFFVLLLRNHKLIYLAETSDAPDTRAFGYAMSSFIKHEYNQYIGREFERLKESGNKITKITLHLRHAPPKLIVVPLPGEDNIEMFISRFSKIQSLKFQLIKPNSEINGETMWHSVRAAASEVQSLDTIVEYRNQGGLSV